MVGWSGLVSARRIKASTLVMFCVSPEGTSEHPSLGNGANGNAVSIQNMVDNTSVSTSVDKASHTI